MIIEELTMPEFEAGLERTRTVLIPFGATEEHGPHLPLATDTLQAAAVGRRLAERRPLFIAPPVPYGVCRSTADHPGTLSIGTATLRLLAIDIVAALYRQGLRHFILLTGHAGGTHTSTLIDAGEELLQRYDDIRVAGRWSGATTWPTRRSSRAMGAGTTSRSSRAARSTCSTAISRSICGPRPILASWSWPTRRCARRAWSPPRTPACCACIGSCSAT
jgi:creatinine amidohydrolase/Fe(II)-dependent formamide hydrolase-like protein